MIAIVWTTMVMSVWCVHQGRVALGLSPHWVRGRTGWIFEILPAPWDRIAGASFNVLAGIGAWAMITYYNLVR